MKIIEVLGFAAAVAACQPRPVAESAAPPGLPGGLAFAQGACGGCHAVERLGDSPNPDSPPFAAIANREGLTADTLSSWLREAHNYPQEMEFSLEGREVDDLVAYILTLRDPNYHPAI